MKVGNFVRPADTAPLAVINQMAPVYVTFAIPQRVLVDLREAMATGGSTVIATIPGHSAPKTGKVAMVENTVDSTTGMVTVRGMMDNENETLWPGTLVNDQAHHPHRGRRHGAVGRACSAARAAISCSSCRTARPTFSRWTISRTFQGNSVIAKGLSGGEDVVIDGQLLLSEGTPVAPRAPQGGGLTDERCRSSVSAGRS